MGRRIFLSKILEWLVARNLHRTLLAWELQLSCRGVCFRIRVCRQNVFLEYNRWLMHLLLREEHQPLMVMWQRQLLLGIVGICGLVFDTCFVNKIKIKFG